MQLNLFLFFKDPEIIKRTREINVDEYPAPAVTICLNLFSRNDTANFVRSQRDFYSNATRGTYSKDECLRLAANFQWCNPPQGKITVKKLCPNHDINNINVVDTLYESSLEVKLFLN